jgi:tetratricopeptide (TPR) repeat protein
MRIDELLAQHESDEAVERLYRAGEAAERAGNLREAAVHFRVAADQRLGDAAVRVAQVLFALGEHTEATRWCRRAMAEGFPEAEELIKENSEARQRFLEHAARIMVGAPTFDWLPVSVPAGHIEPAEVRARTLALRALDRRYGGIACHTSVLAHLAQIEPFIVVGDADLWTAVAEVHELAGWTAFDSGQPGTALPHFSRALTLARQAENEELIASVLTRAGRMFLHHNAPEDAVKAFQLGLVAAHNSWADRRELSDPAQAIAALTTKVDTYGEERVRAHVITLTALARNHLAIGEPAAAGEFAAEAMAAARTLRSARADDQLRWLDQEARAAGASVLVEQISARHARCG